MMIDKAVLDKLDFEKLGGLMPAIVVDASNNQLLMQGFMNQEALEATLEAREVVFYSRSKKRLWLKGESSENYLHVVRVVADCDYDSLLIEARPAGPTCHTGAYSCFHNVLMEVDS
ncbi:phosphoribosyl-AMP cyclohydrolase [Aerococcaceae bacterium DSM 111022]|nr:phosphoribosyl-AMP cyclohydrolase [Aerococcaceae bacterium DSM 111022]